MLSIIARRKVIATEYVNQLLSPLSCAPNFSSKVPARLPDSIQIIKPTSKSSSAAALKIKTISKAMIAYLERSKKHESFLKIKNEEFETGKLHLANMMGLDAATLTQEDIDKAIAYLLPSGLYEPKARPLMKPPVVLFPKEKAAQFDDSGRPFSPFFYTKFHNYFKSLHILAQKFRELDDFEDKMIEKGILEPPSDSKLNLAGGEWLKIEEIRNLFLEKINEEQYHTLITTLVRLSSHPYSFRCKDEICKYWSEFANLATQVIPPLSYDENGRPFVQMKGMKKHSEAIVTVRGNGTGKVTINDTDIFHFPSLQDRETLMYPLHFCNMLEQVDVEALVTGPGTTAQATAIRYGISLCLRSFVPSDFVEKMRIAGLLTLDGRRRGRKKPGQKGNRAKYTWKKR